jgi:hypothetical protein
MEILSKLMLVQKGIHDQCYRGSTSNVNANKGGTAEYDGLDSL